MRNINIDKDFGSIMIIVPHEDDELLMTGGIIKNAIESGVNVKVVMATNGDYDCKDFSVGRARISESIEGLELLGLQSENLIVLGYADTGMPKEESFIWNLYEEKDENKILESSCSKETYSLENHKEYHFKNFNEHSKYTRKNFHDDLLGVIEKYMPKNIFTTSEFDTHGDHSGLYCFVVEILKELREKNNYEPNLYSGIVHSCDGDENWPIITEEVSEFTCPKLLEETSNLKWSEALSFIVPKEMQCNNLKENLKREAISKHRTALKPDAIEFLYSFVKKNEVFWKIKW
ncbi:PIG-L family deacetylase [Clostridium perfringens]|nr:PIG-L family deacetylase [Clostridium perfringens]